MKAIILAAGMGKRLIPLTLKMPKPLVPILGQPIIEYTMEALACTGVSEIIIVVGYKGEAIIEYFEKQYQGIPIRYVENTEYDSTGNIYSLKLALDHVDDDIILCEGDIALDEDTLEILNEKQDENLVFVGKYENYMSGSLVKLDSESMIVRKLFTRAKQQQDLTRLWKTANIYFFTREFLLAHFVPALEKYLSHHTINSYYEVILENLLCGEVNILLAHEIDNTKWMEIDDKDDLEKAEHLFSKDRYKTVKKLYGGYWRHDFLDFCYLFNPYFPPRTFYSKMIKTLPGLFNNYPSAQLKLCQMLSKWYREESFSQENLVIGNGASELIRIINTEITGKITIPVPTFNEYESGLNTDQINYIVLSRHNNYQLKVDTFVRSVKQSGSNIALIINPNNPTGSMIGRQDIISILEQLPDVLLIVDESFLDFAGDRSVNSVQDLVNRFPSLMVIRSLSKEFGVAGLRLGYLLTSNQSIRQKILKRIPIWNVNSSGEYFIDNFPDYRDEYKASIRQCASDRDELFSGLQSISYLEPIPSYANFVFCRVAGRSVRKLSRKLFEDYNILVKDCSSKRSLEQENVMRVAVKKSSENQLLLDALMMME